MSRSKSTFSFVLFGLVLGIVLILFVYFKRTESFNSNKIDIVWSKGYPLFYGTGTKEYIFSGTEEPVTNNDIVEQKGNKYIWVKMGSFNVTENLKTFVDNMYLFDYPFILITTDGDSTIPLDVKQNVLNELLNNKNLITWYTQNISYNEYNKIKAIPIGLDLHTSKEPPSKQLNDIYMIRDKSPKEKKMKIFCDIHLNKNPKFNNPRQQVENLKYSTIDYLSSKIPRNDLWKEYTKYAFVISTHGNGIDCHRTYEILLLGSIVITKTSSLDHLYVGLPVVIVNDWSELNNSSNLKLWYDKYIQLTNNIQDKLKIDNFIKN